VPGGSVAITPVSPRSNDNFDDTLHSVPPPGCCRIPLESWYRAKIHLPTVERAPLRETIAFLGLDFRPATPFFPTTPTPFAFPRGLRDGIVINIEKYV
ncbi:hypothetical protein V1478_004589, partial [Vespula squamosa]